MTQAILKIALDVPLDQLFDYLAGTFSVEVGQRVVVGFAGRKMVGVVMELVSTSELPLEKLKPIEGVFSDSMLLNQDDFKLVRFCSDYYHYPFGQALLSTLPLRMRQTKPIPIKDHFEYHLNDDGRGRSVEDISPRQIVARRIFSRLMTGPANPAELAGISASYRKALRYLETLGWIESKACAPFKHSFVKPSEAPKLNPLQREAVERVVQHHESFKPFLLYGITGSGKTEVYMQILERVLDDNSRQALVLVPEINLTPQLEDRFRKRLPHLSMVSLHSSLSESERLQNWRLAQLGQARIIIGTRLAVFTPIPHLAMIIVDEEHDSSYKQQDSMRYHARDVALVRAQRAKIPAVLGSATPSLETWHHAISGKYTCLTLDQRAVQEASLPAIHTVDITQQPQDKGLTAPLLKGIEDRLHRGEQSLLFINRRGYSPVLLCQACHWVAPCPRCSSKLVVHLKQGRLRCHHCGLEQRITKQCPSCGNADLQPLGHGTQRLEETLKQKFPAARVTRVDRDSVSRKEALNKLLTAMHANEIDILVGTQMLAKGHDFPNLTLVGVIDTDSALFSPDFRATERLFSQLMQVSGRAGRAQKAGEVIIQTSYPGHSLFEAIKKQDYAAYATSLLTEREVTSLPPFSYLALIRAEAKFYRDVEAFLMFGLSLAKSMDTGAMVFGPLRAQMEKLNGMERAHLLIQASQRTVLQKLLAKLTPQLRASKLATRVRWSMDVDPLEF
jgi:primosomal protein N' (replication factor Y) (superfamily II helicase)